MISRRRARAAAAVLGAVAIVVSWHPALATDRLSGPTFGVLDADPSHLSQDRANGVKVATLNVGWNWWEPSPGRFSSSYQASERAVADEYRAAGMSVAVDIGLQYAPAWVSQLPDAQLVDQGGHHAGTLDFAWSQAVRRAATAYLDDVVASLGPVVAYRVGLSENGEALYPDTDGNQWWAFTPSAQGRAGGLPAGTATTPMPGWVPGTPTWNGRAVTVAQATSWYDWYFSGSANALAWEIAAYRATGFTGALELVTPGTGALPAFYDERLSYLLADGSTVGQHYDDEHTLNTAAVWWKLLDDLPDLRGVTIDISSVDDSSGSPRANTCTSADASTPLDSRATWSWSDTRWLTYLAGQHGLPVVGENPGDTPPSELPTVMSLVDDCHLGTIQWAWDDSLYAGGGPASAAQVASAVRGS